MKTPSIINKNNTCTSSMNKDPLHQAVAQIQALTPCGIRLTKQPLKQDQCSRVMQSSLLHVNLIQHGSPHKESTCSAMDQTNIKAICYPETNSNHNFCYVSLVNPFVLLQSQGYGKQLNLHVYEMKKFMLMVHWGNA